MSGSHAQPVVRRSGRFAMRRSRGAVSGLLLVSLGAWGALIPFIGHYFSFGFTPDANWTWTAARAWLEVLPGAVTLLAGLLLVGATNRAGAHFAAWAAAAAGAWFALGHTFSPLWSAGYLGTPDGGSTRAVWEQVGMFSGLGVLVVLLAAIAIGRTSLTAASDLARVDPAPPIDVRDSTRTGTYTTSP